MDEAQQLSILIGGIYDAALDPALWPVVLRKATSFTEGSSASLYSKDATTGKTGAVYYTDGGIDPRYVTLTTSTNGDIADGATRRDSRVRAPRLARRRRPRAWPRA
ncbi:MAG: hypothetical protein ACREDO_12980 [Methyloceanibacter sp.]